MRSSSATVQPPVRIQHPLSLRRCLMQLAAAVMVAGLGACASVGGGSGGPGFYTIERGDTLRSIARSHNIPLLRLTRLNPTLHPDRISRGEQIRLPQSGERAPGQGLYRYRVRSGDTLAALASEFGTSSAAIQRANRGLTPGNLSAGRLIMLPHGRVTSGTTAAQPRPPAPVYRLPAGVGNWRWPVSAAHVSREWGTNANGTLEPMLLSSSSDQIARAANSGTVSFSSSMRQLGNVVVLHHAHDMQSVYAQCGPLRVSAGQHVAAGAPLCTLTGRDQLLFDVRYKGNPVNPRRVLKQQ